MKASEFNEFDDLEYEALLTGSKERSWLWFGLTVSLCLHLALCTYFYRTRFQSMDAVVTEGPPTLTFKVKKVDLAQLEKASADQLNPASKPEPDKTDVQQPDEKKSFDSDKLLQEIATTAIPEEMDALPDKPKVDQADVTSLMNQIEPNTAQNLSNSPNATREQSALNQSSVSGRPQPALSGTELATSTIIKRPNSFTSKVPGDSAGPNKKGTSGFADLDQLLRQQGPLGSGTKIPMPDDQLFGFDSADLQPSSILTRLVDLLKRNPKATFSIEGYTDSIGTDEYNLDLSQRRADSVKQYLADALGIDPIRIKTRGYGKAKFIVPPRPVPPDASQAAFDAEIAREQPNRRVVIVVETNER
ncbi:MAG TPA: OmpA family protein [Chthoniobacterales bacterium]|nr:OmpA family protein [Chthoniobacterales bacterium]